MGPAQDEEENRSRRAGSQEDSTSYPKFMQSVSCTDLVDAFGRVHVRHPEDGCGDRGTPTVLTKLKKWADYASVGKPVRPTKFLPMKTPMSEEIIHNWSLEHPPKHVLTIRRLIESQEREHGRKVGLIIDLANHDCLYIDDLLEYNKNKSAEQDGIVEYVHVGLVAKELPPQEVIDQVQEAAREFWQRKPDSFICLHCCYGFNRTGYVLCSYLCQVHGMSVEESLKSFADARGPGVKHKKFIEALHAKYGVGGVDGLDGECAQETESYIDGKDQKDARGEDGQDLLGCEVTSRGARREGGDDRLREREGVEDKEAELEPGRGACHCSGECMRPGIHHRDLCTVSSPLTSASGSSSKDSSTLTTPEGSRMKFRPASHPIGVLARSAPSSMRRAQTSSSRDLLGDADEWSAVSQPAGGDSAGRSLSRSCNSTGGMLEPEDFDELADTLKFNAAMRREVHVGLAKALHNDFGRHDWHPNEMCDVEEKKRDKSITEEQDIGHRCAMQ